MTRYVQFRPCEISADCCKIVELIEITEECNAKPLVLQILADSTSAADDSCASMSSDFTELPELFT